MPELRRFALSRRSDLLLAAVVAGWVLVYLGLVAPARDRHWMVLVFALPYAAALGVRRRWPVPAAAVACATLAAVWPLGLAATVNGALSIPFFLTPFLFAYSLGTDAGLAVGLAGTVLLAVCLQLSNAGVFNPLGEMLDRRALAGRTRGPVPPPDDRAAPGAQRGTAGRTGAVRGRVGPLRAGPDRQGTARHRRALPQRHGRAGQRGAAGRNRRPRRGGGGPDVGRGGGRTGTGRDRQASRAAERGSGVRITAPAADDRGTRPPGQRHRPGRELPLRGELRPAVGGGRPRPPTASSRRPSPTRSSTRRARPSTSPSSAKTPRCGWTW